MGTPFFRFKQFTVWHDRCGMKVGTDGVLLGAWCPLPSISHARVLDIGVGSGLITLMIAQRLQEQRNTFSICGIDIDKGAVEQSRINFEQSPWSSHLISKESSLQSFEAEKAFDLIVSNPPYFQNSLKNPNAARATARHTETLSYRELICHSKRLLSNDGILALVLPAEAEEEIVALGATYELAPTHITYVHSKPGKSVKRLLIAFTPSNERLLEAIKTHFYIESENSPRSEEYQQLTQAFYL